VDRAADFESACGGSIPPGAIATGNVNFQKASNDALPLLLVYDDYSHPIWFALR
jgi:hypothetical protein